MIKLQGMLTISQAAEFLGVSQSTLRNWEKKYNIPLYRHPLNGYRLYNKQELQNFIDTIMSSMKSNASQPKSHGLQ